MLCDLLEALPHDVYEPIADVDQLVGMLVAAPVEAAGFYVPIRGNVLRRVVATRDLPVWLDRAVVSDTEVFGYDGPARFVTIEQPIWAPTTKPNENTPAESTPSGRNEALVCITGTGPWPGVLILEGSAGMAAQIDVRHRSSLAAATAAMTLATLRGLQTAILSETLDHTDSAISLVDATAGEIAFRNATSIDRAPGATSATGDETLYAHVHPDDRARLLADTRRVLETNTPGRWRYRALARAPDGSRDYRWTETVFRPVDLLPGQDGYYISLSHDVHELQTLQLSLSHARDAAIASDQAKSEFLGGLSHTLRTPVGVLTGFLQLIELETNEVEVRHYASSGSEVAGRLNELIDVLLELSRLEAGTLQPVITPVNVPAVVSRAVSTVAAQLPSPRLYPDIEPGLPRLLTDGELLHAALASIIRNAVQYAPGPPAPSMRVETVPSATDPKVAFVICDAGPGMTPAELVTARTTFERLRRHRHIEGHGLGISHAEQIVALLGGEMTIDSSPGSGTSVVITMPVLTVRGLRHKVHVAVIAEDTLTAADIRDKVEARRSNAEIVVVSVTRTELEGNPTALESVDMVVIDTASDPALIARALSSIDALGDVVPRVVWLARDPERSWPGAHEGAPARTFDEVVAEIGWL